uniref:Protein kinase domain-containing protein n=1 Tax=Chromera velia CCMP2878 TaxID=1169474 RepID=A0A0G4HWD3_9ALVE|eukprot:Cvel_9019.t1-p1 / transcript=Cvel_9019.t1 / gene=Cvel_9019 / organism=Chromera_velia_CCMP2878 / gene_product=Mitogen-activated protein kinase spk1, putative / transcript_product=Mitogen-activated protein kinase spk1, putative / location=Cvel_scaffold511:429-5465(+) / protein_length=775 / sequence_SO=supercontig / SO=protein_coding / is_pseudo=false
MTGAGIMHRDIKPRNLLVNANCDLKVCDFGLACPRKECGREGEGGPSSRLTQYVQTRWYRAPEVLYSAFDYDEKVDVWSAGCILSEFFAVPRVVSFRGKSTKGQVEEIITKLGKPSEEEIAEIPHPAVRKLIRSIPTTTLMSPQSIGRAFPIATQSADLCDLLFGLLRFSPKRRFSVEEAISHRFFGQLHDPEDEPLAPPVPPSALDVEKVPNIHGNGNNQNSSSQQSQSTSREGTSRRSNSNSCCSSSAATQTHMLSQTPAGTCKGPAASSTGLECRGTSAAEEGPSRGPGGAARSLLSRAQKVYGGVQNALRMSGRGIGLGMSGMGTGGEREKERRESAGVGGQAEGAEEAEREKDSAKRQAAAQHDGGKVRASSYSSSHPPPGREASSFFSSSSSSSSSRPMPVQRERSEKETALHHNHQQQQGERRGGTGDNAGGDGGAAPPPTTTHHQPVPPPVHQQGRRKEKETGGWGGHHHQQQPPHCLPFGGDVEAMRVFLLESLIAEGAPLLSTAQQTVTVVGGAAGLSPIMPSSAAAMMHTNSHRGNTWPHQGCDASKSTREADDGMSGLAGTRGGSDGGSGSRGRGASTASGGTTGGGVSGSLASFSFSGSGGSGSRTLTDLEPSSSGTLTGTVTDPRGEWKCGGGMLGGGPGVGAERDGLLSICRGSCASSQPSSNSSSSLMNSVAAAAAAAAAGAGGASLFAAASTPPRNSLPLPGGERDRGGGGGFCTLVSADSAALRESALVGEALLPVGSVCSSTNSIPLQQQRGKGRG